jgi:DNA repair exonuclease SbcCD ATPase subunit
MKNQRVMLSAVFAVSATVVALLIWRGCFGDVSGRIDRENAALRSRLEAAERLRDSLQALMVDLDRQRATLQNRERRLIHTNDSLDAALAERDRRLRTLQRTLTRYDLPADSLVRDLNAILAGLGADTGPGPRR